MRACVLNYEQLAGFSQLTYEAIGQVLLTKLSIIAPAGQGVVHGSSLAHSIALVE